MYNLIGLNRTEAVYIRSYGAAFPEPARVGAYNLSIDKDATAVICACTEAAHKVKRID